jgi:hypothetical protein
MGKKTTKKKKMGNATCQQAVDTMEYDKEAHRSAVWAAEQELITMLAHLVLAAVEQGADGQ